MPQGVVHLLETIQIQHQRSLFARAVHQTVHLFIYCHAVGQTGEHIRFGGGGQLLVAGVELVRHKPHICVKLCKFVFSGIAHMRVKLSLRYFGYGIPYFLKRAYYAPCAQKPYKNRAQHHHNARSQHYSVEASGSLGDLIKGNHRHRHPICARNLAVAGKQRLSANAVFKKAAWAGQRFIPYAFA